MTGDPLRVIVRCATDDGAVPFGNDPGVTVAHSIAELVIGGARADLAVIVIEAREGITGRTRRDTAIVGRIGIDPVVFAIDGGDDDEARFREIEHNVAGLAKRLGIEHVITVPLPSALDDCMAAAGIARGDVIAATDSAVAVADQLQATLIWLADAPLVPGRSCQVRLGTVESGAAVSTLKHRLDFTSGALVNARSLARDQIGVVTLTLDRALAFDSHAVNRDTSNFTLHDPDSGAEIGFGIIEYALRRATNVKWHETTIDKAARARLKGQKPVCLWFTGLSGAGKSSVANRVDMRLVADGRHTYVLDGDNVRHGLNHDLGFTEADRVENIRRMAEVAKLMVDAGLIVMVCAISPYSRDRDMARGLFEDGEFIEVFVDTTLDACEARDPKGLYQKARAGEIPNFTGISAPYEAPETPEIHLDGTQPIDGLVARVFEKLG